MKPVIAIIGAGAAGLSAGYELLSQLGDKYSVCILESSNQVGGLAKSIDKNGFKIDIGGHRYFSKNPNIISWWNDILPKGDLLKVRRHSKILYNQKLLDYPLSLKSETIKAIGFARGVGILTSFFRTANNKATISSLEDLYIKRFGFKLYDLFFNSYTKKLWGRYASEILPDWGYQRVNGLSISKAIANAFFPNNKNKEKSLVDCFYYPKYGSGYIWDKVAAEIQKMGGRILLGECVTDIHIVEGSVKSITCQSGLYIEPEYLISSIPLRELINKTDAVPDQIANIAKGLEYRAFIIVGLLFPKNSFTNTILNSSDGKLIEDQWIYVQDKSVNTGRIQLFDNWSSSLKTQDESVCLGLEFFCSEDDYLWNTDDDKFVGIAVNELKKLNFLNADADAIDFIIHREKHAYPCYWDTYTQIDKLKTYINSVKNLICIGRNGQHHYNNIDHSMETGFKAVETIKGKSTKEDIWKVNTDKSYHEEK